MTTFNMLATGGEVRGNGSTKTYTTISKTNVPRGKPWDVKKIIDIILDQEGDTSKAVTILAEKMFIYLMSLALKIMLIPGDIKLNVFTSASQWVGPPDRKQRTFHFTSDNVRDEWRRFAKFLKEADLVYLGPLMEIARAFGTWSHQRESGKVLATLQISW